MPISFKTFQEYAQNHIAIPVYEQLVFDAHPSYAFYRLKDEPNYVFLEVYLPMSTGRYSYLGLDPHLTANVLKQLLFLQTIQVAQLTRTVFDALINYKKQSIT